jgi:O-antigen ligase
VVDLADRDSLSRDPVRFRRVSSNGDLPPSLHGTITYVVEQILLFIAVLAFLGITRMPSDVETTALSTSNPMSTAAMGLLLAVTVPALVLYARDAGRLFLGSPILVVFLAMTVLSIGWSDYPDIAARRVGTFLIPLFCALLLSLRHDMRDIVVQIGRMILILTVVSALLALFVPRIGVMHEIRYADSFVDLTGAWRGVTNHKSSLGSIASLGAQIYAWRFFCETRRRPYNALIVAFMTVVAFEARSSTAIIAVAFALAVLSVLAARRHLERLGSGIEAAFWMAVAGISALIPILLSTFVGVLGKDVTLTGRIPLWHELMYYVAQKPWLGFGYGTFWVDGSPNILRLNEIVTWNPPNSHNAYLELVLNLGLVGAVIGTIFMLSVIVRAYRLARNDGPAWTIYAAVFGIAFAATNMVDTMLLKSGDFYCFLLMLCHFGLVKYRLEQGQVPGASRFQRQFLPREFSASPLSRFFGQEAKGDGKADSALGRKNPRRRFLPLEASPARSNGDAIQASKGDPRTEDRERPEP